MQFKNQWLGEAPATPAYPLDSREETIFEAPGGPRSWIEARSFGADTETAVADLIGSPHESGTRKSTAPVVSAPQIPSLRSQYVIGLLGICLVFVPMLEALGTRITMALAVAAAVQIKEWVMYAQVGLGLGLFGLGCFGPTDALVDIFICCVFGF